MQLLAMAHGCHACRPRTERSRSVFLSLTTLRAIAECDRVIFDMNVILDINLVLLI